MPCKTINRGLLGILVCVLALVLFAVLGLTQPARAEVNASGNIIFPDANFKAALIGLGVDTGSDGEITPDEAAAYTGDEDGFFVVNHANISDLSGVEYFTGVSSLFCNNNILASLDVSGMINLEELHCDNNPLNTLNVSGCTSLLRLYVGETNITALDVSDCTQLEYIAGFDLTNVKFDGGREIITNVSPSGGGTLRFGYEATLGKMISLHAEPSTGMYFESWTTSENIELIYAQNIIPPLDIQIDLEALPTRPITITANFSDEPFEYASPTTALDDVLDEIAGKDADAILNELEAIDNLAGLLQNPVNEDKLAAIETAYIAKSGITADVIVDPDTHENFVEDVNVSAVGLAFNGQPTTSVELVFSPPEQQAALPSGSDYLTDNAVWVDIKLIVDDTTEITNLNVPIAITVKIPEGIDPAKLVILHYFQSPAFLL